MKAYMVYDRYIGPGEAAMLVFANTAQEARKVSYGLEWCNSDWTAWTATLIRDLPDHLKALDDGTVSVVTAPPVCEQCKSWGGHPKGPGCSLCTEDWEVTEVKP